jgi:UDP-N-acetylmuramoylalanine--D-glutamate ligase
MVVGLGASGKAAARLLASHQAELVLTDRREDAAIADLPPATFRLGTEDPAWLAEIELLVVSPGVPLNGVLVNAASKAGIPVIGEMELASRFIDSPLIAVTGTNGKSTTTSLLGEMFKRGGFKTFVGGNLGTPLSAAAGGGFDIVIAEVSSYQLETIERFKPGIAIHLNLTADHLDRYHDFEDYARAKAQIFANQDAHDWAILNRDDPNVWQLRDRLRARVLSFGVERPSAVPAIWHNDSEIYFDLGEISGRLSLADFKLPGSFNHINAMAAAAAALAFNLAPGIIERTIAEFVGLPHRLQFVRRHNGVSFFDDSKGTNVGAVAVALAAVQPPVILIAGGVDKCGSYAPLIEPLRKSVKLLVLYGEARETIHRAVNGVTRLAMAERFEQAVRIAAVEARSGDTVLLSPGCSSFDQFRDYAERGRVFQELVRAL